MKEFLLRGLNALGTDVSEKQISQLEIYAELLAQWNEKINLTAITQPEEVALKHFIDSATCIKAAELSGRVIDVGTGAGFPGLVLKILKPGLEICLLDSLQKRLAFLREVCDKTGLDGVSFVHARAEDGGQNSGLRESFDFAVARAVANLSVLSEYCLPFVKVGGSFVSMKGPDGEAECAEAEGAIKKLGGQVERIEKLTLPESDISRTIITVKKLRQTPSKYPRKAGKPTKEPLK